VDAFKFLALITNLFRNNPSFVFSMKFLTITTVLSIVAILIDLAYTGAAAPVMEFGEVFDFDRGTVLNLTGHSAIMPRDTTWWFPPGYNLKFPNCVTDPNRK
jgi:hypothetical protein